VSAANVLGFTLINVSASQCGSGGLELGESTLENVNASYNNGVGIYIDSGTIKNSQTNFNKSFGIVVGSTGSDAGTVENSSANHNVIGMLVAGTVTNSSASFNSQDGFNTTNALLVSDNAYSNLGDGFNLGPNTCYANIRAYGNGTNVSGGTAIGSSGHCP